MKKKNVCSIWMAFLICFAVLCTEIYAPVSSVFASETEMAVNAESVLAENQTSCAAGALSGNESENAKENSSVESTGGTAGNASENSAGNPSAAVGTDITAADSGISTANSEANSSEAEMNSSKSEGNTEQSGSNINKAEENTAKADAAKTDTAKADAAEADTAETESDTELQIVDDGEESVNSNSSSGGTSYKVTASYLTVRGGSSVSYPAIGYLSRGSQVTVLAVSSNNWGKINYKNKTGWISLKYCEKTSSPTVTTTEKAKTTTEKSVTTTTESQSQVSGQGSASGEKYRITASCLTVRNGAGVSYRALGYLNRGTEVSILAVSNGSWGKISYNGKTGWISMKYCMKESSSSSVETTTAPTTESTGTSEGQTSGSAAAGGNTASGESSTGSTASGGSTAGSTTSGGSTYRVSTALNIRTGTSAAYARLGTLAEGTIITVYEVSSNNWGKIVYYGQTGWVSLKYCTQQSAVAATEKTTTATTESAAGQTEAGASGSQTSGSGTEASETTELSKLHVSGTNLVDENGNVVQLKGVSTHGIAWFPQYINQSLFTELHDDWDANVIRLSMYSAEYNGYCTGGDQEALKQEIEKGVEYAVNAGMYVIIDWHILSDGNPNTYKTQSLAFFEEMSKKYADCNNVIYEICNEPNGGTSWSTIKSYSEEIIQAIRKNDDAPVIVGTPNWSQRVDEAAANPITSFSNILYALHFYAGTHKDDLRNTLVSAVKSGLAVFVSEYGTCDASGNGGLNTTEANKWISLLNQYKIGSCNWSLSNKSETASIIKSSCTKTSGLTYEDLSESGKWLYNMLTGKTTLTPSSQNTSGSTDSQTSGTSQSTGSQTSGTSQNTGSQSSGSQSSGNQTSGSTASTSRKLTNADVSITLTPQNSWESNGSKFTQYSCTIRNTSAVDGNGWEISYTFPTAIELSSGWCGTYSVSGKTLTISSMDYNGSIKAGASIDNVGFIIQTR